MTSVLSYLPVLEEDEQARQTLSGVTSRVITELRCGSIEGITVFASSDLTDPVEIATGTRSEVYRARLRNNKLVAVKVLKHQFALDVAAGTGQGEKLISYFIRECGTWKSVDSHPNIVTVLGFTEIFQGSGLPAIVTDYYELKDFRRYLCEMESSVPEQARIKLITDASSGLAYLHAKRIFHRDIKASNIFLRRQDGNLEAAIGDFGSAKLENPDLFNIAKSTATTSLAWTPPEYISDGIINYSSPSEAGDVWSLGCTILEVMIEDDPWPFGENIRRRLMQKQHPPRPDGLKDGLWDIITLCWKSEPKRRKSAFIIDGLLRAYLVS